MNKIRNELLGYGFTEVDQVYDPSGTKTQVRNALNEGRRVVNYCGHGSTTSWGTTGFSNSDVNGLTNVGKLPFICSVACVNGAFGSGTCFAEAWLRATHNGEPSGAIAAYMSSVNQSWAPPMYAQGNHSKSGKEGAAERFWKEINQTIAGVWFGGSCTMMDLAGSSGRQEFMNWILFGDPSLGLYDPPNYETLLVSSTVVPLNTPVTIDFTITPGGEHAGKDYLLLGSVSGTDPGTTLPSGVVIPLNFDVLTFMIINNPNSPVFQNFLGTLDGSGEAIATFSTEGLTPLDPGLAGVNLYFAATLSSPGQAFELATNAQTLTITE
jgi:hypothetical protein